ncbi:MAG: cytochrome c oxidase assembly protein [Acidimicrobiales bacterium]
MPTTASGLGLDPLALVPVVSAAVLYRAGTRRLARRGRAWPRGRSVLFGLGLIAIVSATQGPIAAADARRLSAHMAQHLLIGMVAPLLLALAAPLTLALQAGGDPGRARLRRLLHGPSARALAHPLLGITLFGASIFALYFTPLLALSLRNALVHAVVHLHVFAAGAVFLWPVVAVDPVAARPGHPLRLLAVFVTLPLHTILGLAILSGGRLLAGGWYGRVLGPAAALDDQHVAGGILWVSGEVVGLALAGLVLSQWMAADEREAVRHDRRLDRLAAATAATEGA